jgi:murein DD-endopeptidase MepM/ murein hydrolase activator NlpD
MPGEINTGSGSVRSEYPLGVGQKPANTMKHIDSESKKRDVSEPKPPQANAETDRLMRAHVFSANQSKEKLAYADKRAFSEKFIEIYFEDEEKKSLINSVKTMSNTEFEFFWKTLLDYLAKESNGKLYMAPILKEDGLTKGSRIGPRYFIKVYKNGKVRLKFISKEKSEEILKEKGKAYYKKNVVIKNHKGNDIPTEKGTPIYLPAPGKVKSITKLNDIRLLSGEASSESIVEIDHGKGVISRFVHLDKTLPKAIKKDAILEFGTIIGHIDGRPSERPNKKKKGEFVIHSSNSHLHLEVKSKNKYKNYDEMIYLRPGKFNFSESNKKQAGSKIHTKEFTAFLNLKKQEQGFISSQQIALNR